VGGIGSISEESPRTFFGIRQVPAQLWLAGILVVAALIRLFRSSGVDSSAARWARSALPEAPPYVLTLWDLPLLLPLRIFSEVSGPHEAGIYGVNFIASLLAIAGTYGVSFRWTGSKTAGLASAFLLGISPLSVFSSTLYHGASVAGTSIILGLYFDSAFLKKHEFLTKQRAALSGCFYGFACSVSPWAWAWMPAVLLWTRQVERRANPPLRFQRFRWSAWGATMAASWSIPLLLLNPSVDLWSWDAVSVGGNVGDLPRIFWFLGIVVLASAVLEGGTIRLWGFGVMAFGFLFLCFRWAGPEDAVSASTWSVLSLVGPFGALLLGQWIHRILRMWGNGWGITAVCLCVAVSFSDWGQMTQLQERHSALTRWAPQLAAGLRDRPGVPVYATPDALDFLRYVLWEDPRPVRPISQYSQSSREVCLLVMTDRVEGQGSLCLSDVEARTGGRVVRAFRFRSAAGWIVLRHPEPEIPPPSYEDTISRRVLIAGNILGMPKPLYLNALTPRLPTSSRLESILAMDPMLNRPRLAGRECAFGIRMASNTSVEYLLGGRFSRLEARVGLDESERRSTKIVYFSIRGDGRRLYRSKWIRSVQTPQKIDVDVREIQTLLLTVENRGDVFGTPNAVWADVVLHPQWNR